MATLSYDGQSFIIDGRRVWLVSATLDYGRMPASEWAERIRAARNAGFNCALVPVPWCAHEPSAGRFLFEQGWDLRGFIQQLQAERMYCILRPGPYIGAGWDNGALPPWLRRESDVGLRQADPSFLEACSRYLGAVMEQIRDLQVTSPTTSGPAGREEGGGDGPIVAIQTEHGWWCHNPDASERYLHELVRYLRENGCTVPVTVCNNLWQRVEDTLDTWSGSDRLLADLRQLRVVQPEAPPFVTDQAALENDVWGRPHPQPGNAQDEITGLAEILAAGGQFNHAAFHGGTQFGFSAGRAPDAPEAYHTTSRDGGALLTEQGEPTARYRAVKRIATFASHFGQVMAHLDPARSNHAAAAPWSERHPLTLVHQRGSQGEVIFFLRDAQDRTDETELLLPSGLTLPVPMGQERVAWVLLEANLGPAGELTYTNLRPWCYQRPRQGRPGVLALFGPGGADGTVCLNGAPLHVRVPSGRRPLVEQHEELTVVVMSTEQADAAFPLRDGLVVGAGGLDAEGNPQPLSGWCRTTWVHADGSTQTKQLKTASRPRAPRLGEWEQAVPREMLDGSSDRFTQIEEPQSLEARRCDHGYGWYRIALKGSSRGRVLLPEGGDRLHLFRDGKLRAVLGNGPGATADPADLSLGGTLVVLADNLGRFDGGWRLGERKGLPSHLHTVKNIQLPKGKTGKERAPDPFTLGAFFEGLRRGEPGMVETQTWSLRQNSTRPVIVDVQGLPVPALLLVNDHPVGLVDPVLSGGGGRFTLQVNVELKRGTNALKLAAFEPLEEDARNHVRAYQSTKRLTEGAQWAFAPWKAPVDEAFEPLRRQSGAVPCWYRTNFRVTDASAPLWLRAQGLSKGQIYLNGRNVGRYFMTTQTRKHVGPQRAYRLPSSWLRGDEPNELMLFDEHGRSPEQCKLTHSAQGAFE